MRGGRPRRRPPWWPENESWPPRSRMGGGQWGPMGGHFFRRVAMLFAAVVILTVGAATFLFWLVASALGASDLPGTMARGVALIVLVLALAFAARAVRRLAAPVADVIEAAGRVEAGDYTARVDERGPREVRSLARAFNAMSARLQASEEQRRKLLADVSHELRTPLAVVQGNLEALLDGVYPADPRHLEPILDETRVLARLVEDLRTLSLAEAGVLALHREPTDLAGLANETLESFRAEADRAEVALDATVDSAVPPVEVDPVRTREILANLVANALRYTPRGGRVRVDAALADGGGMVAVSVSDTGAGIPAEALGLVFDRFYKSAESRGAGLGLAIAKNLVVAHGGEIAAASTPGGGTTIRFTLPVGS